MREVWRDIKGYEGLYTISNLGRVKSFTGYGGVLERILKPCRTSKTNLYLVVGIGGKSRLVHRLVLETFRGKCPDGMEACHKDGNPQNNQLSNLRWGTPKANAADRTYHGRTAMGWRVSASKTATMKRQAIVDMHYELGYSIEDLAKIFLKPVQTIEYLIATYPNKS